MPDIFFDHSNPFEKQVSERLTKYLHQGLPHDTVLDMIGRDFPYIDEKVRENCENVAYLHYHSGEDGNIIATFKRVALLHSRFIDEPFYSHQGYDFHLRAGEDIVVAVQVENPLYKHDKADVHLTFHIDGVQVNEFRHTMSRKERRSVYYVPLNVLEHRLLPAETYASIKIDVVDANIKGMVHSMESDVYYGETDPSEVFELVDFKLCNEYDDTDREVLDIRKTESLILCVSVKHGGHYGHIEKLGGSVTISPSDSSDRRNTLVSSVMLMDCPGMDGCIDAGIALCNMGDVPCDNTGSLPFFRPDPGKYTVNFFILDTLLCSREIEFIESDDEVNESEADSEPES